MRLSLNSFFVCRVRTFLSLTMGKAVSSRFARVQKGRRRANLSRKQIFEARRKEWEKKKAALDLVKREERRKKVEKIKKAQNKRSHREFDHTTLRVVQNGLTSAIETLGEKVQPLSVYMAAFSAASNAAEKKHIPYLLSILSASISKLSQGVLLHESPNLFKLAEQLLAENGSTDALITAKVMKLVQTMMLAFEQPTMNHVQSFMKIKPSNLNVEATELYLVTFRKFLEQCALSYSKGSSPMKDVQTGFYPLSVLQRLYTTSIPHFVDICLKNMIGTPGTGVSITFRELNQLWKRSLSPYLVESREGQDLLDHLLSHQLLSMLKPAYQHIWPMAMELVETLFSRINYLKRVANNSVSFTVRFPSIVFFLKVLHKLRCMNDSTLNGKVERAMISIAKAMSVREFVNILPFDPKRAFEAERNRELEECTVLWSTSYTLDVIRRSSSHDSLPFFKEHFFPIIQFCSRQAVESEKSSRQEEFFHWSALLTQYWRIAVGFFHYPIEITESSFRDVAKQLVGLLSNKTFADTSATAIHVLADGYYQLAKSEEVENDPEDEEEKKLEGDLREDGRAETGVEKRGLEEDDLFLSLNYPSWNPHVYHNISKEKAEIVCSSIISKYSSNIMPKLCNVFESHNSMAILLAIQSFSKVCKPEVMEAILRGILEVGSSIAEDIQEKQQTEIYGGVSSFSPSQRCERPLLSSKRRMILDIACAITPQLSQEDITHLFNDVIEPVLMDPTPENSRILQKKAYKLLLAMFEHRVKDLFSFLPSVLRILSVGRQHVTISGMKMRLRCLSWVLDACKMFYPDDMLTTIRGTIGEIVAFARERSNDTRNLTMDILEKMQRYLSAGGAPVNMLLHLVAGGLAAKTPMVLSSTIVCMAKIVFLTHDHLPEKDLQMTITMGTQLMTSKTQEVSAAATLFVRMALKLSKRSHQVKKAVEDVLPKLLYAIALITSQSRVSSKVRMEMRILLEKTIKRFTYEKVDPMFPVGSKNFLRYTYKMMKRDEKKAEKALQQRSEKQKNEFAKLFLNAEMQTTGSDAPEMDLLEAGALSTFVAQHAAPVMPGFSGDVDEDDYDQLRLDFVDGKLRIQSATEWKTDLEVQKRKAMTQKLLGSSPMHLAGKTLADGAHRPGKRGRDELEDFVNEELVLRYGAKTSKEASENLEQGIKGNSSRLLGPSAHQIQKLRSQKEEQQVLKRMRVEEDIRKGEEFIGAGLGDVKRGNVDPFAYVPLNRRYMNRRNARHSLHRFEVISHKQLKGEKAKAIERLEKK